MIEISHEQHRNDWSHEVVEVEVNREFCFRIEHNRIDLLLDSLHCTIFDRITHPERVLALPENSNVFKEKYSDGFDIRSRSRRNWRCHHKRVAHQFPRLFSP